MAVPLEHRRSVAAPHSRLAADLLSWAGSLAARAYGATEISERHRHRWEVSNAYRDVLAEHGMRLSGQSPDGGLVEIIELPDHPWYLGCQFHPELSDGQVAKLVGTTKPTIESIRDRTHWNSNNLTPQDPVALGLCSQVDLDAEVKKAALRLERGVTRRSGRSPWPGVGGSPPTVSRRGSASSAPG